jgi:hypothetical protein
MSVISVAKQSMGDSGDYSLNESNRNNPVLRNTNWVFHVLFDTSATEADDAITASDIPSVGDNHPSRSYTRCKSISAVRDGKNACLWLVNVKWGSTTEGMTGTWDEHLEIDGVEFTQDAYFAFDATDGTTEIAVANSAGQAFDPTLTKTFYDSEIKINFCSRSVPVDAISACLGGINSDTVSFTVLGVAMSYAAKTLKLVAAPYQTVYENGDNYWKIAYTIRYRADTWVDKVIDQGYATIDSDTGDLKIIKDADGNPLNAPAKLDGSGQQLDSGGDPVYLQFQVPPLVDLMSCLDVISGIG